MKDDKVLGYTASGATIDPRDLKCYAKLIVDGKTGVCSPFVKFGISGYAAGEIFNPFNDYTGRTEWDFKRVKMVAFDHYLNFLKTRNDAHFRAAERGLYE